MKFQQILTAILFLICCSGCFEILEEVDLAEDGSGHLTYTLNMSQSKDRLKTLMSLDTLNGMRIPSRSKIEGKITAGTDVIKSSPGISNSKMMNDFENFIFRMELDFDNLTSLNKAIEQLHNHLSPFGLSFARVYSKSSNGFDRDIDVHSLNFIKFLNGKSPQLLRDSYYTVIYRFNKSITQVGSSGVMSKNKRAAKFSHNLSNIANERDLMHHHISF